MAEFTLSIQDHFPRDVADTVIGRLGERCAVAPMSEEKFERAQNLAHVLLAERKTGGWIALLGRMNRIVATARIAQIAPGRQIVIRAAQAGIWKEQLGLACRDAADQSPDAGDELLRIDPGSLPRGLRLRAISMPRYRWLGVPRLFTEPPPLTPAARSPLSLRECSPP